MTFPNTSSSTSSGTEHAMTMAEPTAVKLPPVDPLDMCISRSSLRSTHSRASGYASRKVSLFIVGSTVRSSSERIASG